MSAAANYARLRALGTETVTTAEAAAALRTSTSSASRALRTLAGYGLVGSVGHGLWRLGRGQDARQLAAEITRPYPAYVSFESALSAHGMIDQLPREIALASLSRSKRVRTPDATYAVHHLPPELFGGYEEERGFPLATPEKALFDWCYVSEASARPGRRLPEIETSSTFSEREFGRWLGLIRDDRLRRRVGAALEELLASAEREGEAEPLAHSVAAMMRSERPYPPRTRADRRG